MSVSYWQDRSANKCNDFDVVIIGGGIAGLSTAYWLHHSDASLKIAVVEKYQLGAGATGRNAGFITCGSVEHFNRLVQTHGENLALEMWRYSEENLNLLKSHIIQNDGAELLFEQQGSFSLASDDVEFKELQKSASIMSKLNIDVEVLDAKQCEQRLGVMNFVGGIKYKQDAAIHPLNLLMKIKDKLADKITLFENHEVYSLQTQGEDKLVKTNQRTLKAPLIVMATNAYSALLNDYFKDKIFPTRGQILATAPVPRFMEGPCYANFVLDYFRQLPTGELIIGGFRQLQKDVEKGYSDETSEIIQMALEDFIRKHIPNLKQTPITHRWSGIMGFSVDGQPMVGSLKTDPSIFFLGGFTAHGLGLSFHSGKCLADLIFGKTIPGFLNAKRF